MNILRLLFLFVLSVFGANKSENKNQKLISNFACVKRIYSVLDRWEAPEKWEVKSEGSVIDLESKTNSKEVVLNLRYNDHFSEITRITSSEKYKMKFENPNCDLELSIRSKKYESKKGYFTDYELAKLLEKSMKNKTKGMIYVWSPNMNLSIRGLKEAADLAKNMRLEFTPLLDPFANDKTAKEVMKNNQWSLDFLTRLESSILIHQDALIHYPALFLIANGKLLNITRLGYDDNNRLRKFIEIKL